MSVSLGVSLTIITQRMIFRHLKDIGESLSIVYMRQSFVGFDVLQKTTLSDLGLSTGKAVLRYDIV